MTTNPRAWTWPARCSINSPRSAPASASAGARRWARALQAGLDGLITGVRAPAPVFLRTRPQFKCYGADSTEEWLRERGIGVIHGGANSLRFTPRFETTSDELELLVSMVGRALREGPRRDRDTAA